VSYLTAALAEPTIRGSAALALGRLKAREAVPALARNLRVNSDLDRNAAVIALCRIGDAAAAPAPLDVALHDESWGIRTCAIDALATLGDPRGVQLLAQLALNPRPLLAGAIRSFDAMPRPLARRPSIHWTRRWALRRLRQLRAIDTIELLEPASRWRLSAHAIRLKWTIHALRAQAGPPSQ
jgi:HEAT repeat protein